MAGIGTGEVTLTDENPPSAHRSELLPVTIHANATEAEHAGRWDDQFEEQLRQDELRRDLHRLDRHRFLALERLRTMSGLSVRTAAKRIGVKPSTLRSWEERHAVPSPTELDAALAVYGSRVEDLLPPRQPLESPNWPGVLVVGAHTIDTNEIRRAVPDVAECNRRILVAYLDVVKQVRGLGSDERPALRSNDLLELARVLDISDHHLDELLVSELQLSEPHDDRTIHALLVAGLMSSSQFERASAGWIDDPDSVTTTDPCADGTSRHNGSVFATVSVGSRRAALRRLIFSSAARPDTLDEPASDPVAARSYPEIPMQSGH